MAHINSKLAVISGILFGASALSSCGKAPADAGPRVTVAPGTRGEQARYSWIRDTIFAAKCMDCHSADQGDGDGLDHANFDTYEKTLGVVKPGDPAHSKLYIVLKKKKMPKAMDPMPGMPNPPPPVPLTDSQLQAIWDWILAGAPND